MTKSWAFVASNCAIFALSGCSRQVDAPIRIVQTLDGASTPMIQNLVSPWENLRTVSVGSWPSRVLKTADGNTLRIRNPIGPFALSDTLLVVGEPATAKIFVQAKDSSYVTAFIASPERLASRERLSDILACGDTIVGVDKHRISFWSTSGHLFRTMSIDSLTSLPRALVKGVTADCSTWLIQYPNNDTASSNVSAGSTLVWTQSVTGVSSHITNSVERSTRKITYANREVSLPTLWQPQFVFAARAGVVITGHQGIPEIRMYDATAKRIMAVRWEGDARKVLTEDLEQFMKVRARAVRQRPAEAPFLPPVEVFPREQTYPQFNAILLGTAREMLVQEYGRHLAGLPTFSRIIQSESRERWAMFDSAGHYRARLELPKGFSLTSFDGHAVHGTQIGQTGVTTIRSYRLRWPER